MFRIWAIFSLVLGAAILLGIAWFFLTIIGKIIFEDLIGDTISKVAGQKRRKEQEKDHYIY
jgi:hypothetical protein